MSNVRFLHLRNIVPDDDSVTVFTQKGGKTIAYTFEDGRLTYAVAKCGRKENYCRRTGRLISQGRLNAGKVTQVACSTGPIDMLVSLEG